MYHYKFGEKMTADILGKLLAQVPSQAGAILQATWDIATNERAVSEDEIIDKIESDLKKYSPRAKGPEVIPGFVAYYRQMLGKLPAHILEQTKDNTASKARGGGRASKAETMIDPITGETIPNVFKRAPVKNPGSRKTRKIVTEELLGDDDDMPELEDDSGEVPMD